MFHQIYRNIRHGLRGLSRTPSLSFVALAVIALGIGPTSSLFGAMDALLFRPLPFKQPERLTEIKGGKIAIKDGKLRPDIHFLKSNLQFIDDAAAYAAGDLNVSQGGDTQSIRSAQVSANFFALLGRYPMLGRAFSAEDEDVNGNYVVILSYRLWQQFYGAEIDVIGRRLIVNGEHATVIGVMPKDFRFPDKVDLWAPIGRGDDTIFRGSIIYKTIARLKQNVTVLQASSEVKSISARPKSEGGDPSMMSVEISPLHQSLVETKRGILLSLFGAVLLVLLISCFNLAGLLLIRSIQQQKDYAIRAALGASRLQLLGQILTESILLSAAGGILGVSLSFAMQGAISKIIPPDFMQGREITRSFSVVIFGLGASVLTGVLCGLIPMAWISKADLNGALKGRVSRSLFASRQALRKIIIIAEVAATLVLLSGAGLFIKSFINLVRDNSGLDPNNVLTMQLSLPAYYYKDANQRRVFCRQVLEQLQSVPGIASSAVVNYLPFGETTSIRLPLIIEGRAPVPGEAMPSADYRVVSPDYFKVLSIPIVKGRPFNLQDVKGSPDVIIINDIAAKRFFSEGDPIGKIVSFDAMGKQYEIVGVVGGVKYWGANIPPDAEVYLPYLQSSPSYLSLVVKTKDNPLHMIDAVKRVLKSVDDKLPTSKFNTMNQLIVDSFSTQRFMMMLMIIFAALAMLLASAGLYGFMSYSVSQRTQEIGVRIALGARPSVVLRLAAKQGVYLIILGIIIGIVASALLNRTISTYLYEASPMDWLMYLPVVAILSLVSLIAVFIPSGRATRVDPLIAMRQE